MLSMYQISGDSSKSEEVVGAGIFFSESCVSVERKKTYFVVLVVYCSR